MRWLLLCRSQFGFHSARVRFRSVSDSDSVSISLFAVFCSLFGSHTCSSILQKNKKKRNKQPDEIHKKPTNAHDGEAVRK
ncbi:hypothetical protein M5D96_001696 [Drosophila gunungcola]|uniref:Uncharacterized protein n=1 Tax=Drosophila gunungcola TaxID=103775 RepID=A0A9Q0BVN6_9MUSC|nr:hypothetical protein M5D96_001696 [Drosophila gunungcola]